MGPTRVPARPAPSGPIRAQLARAAAQGRGAKSWSAARGAVRPTPQRVGTCRRLRPPHYVWIPKQRRVATFVRRLGTVSTTGFDRGRPAQPRSRVTPSSMRPEPARHDGPSLAKTPNPFTVSLAVLDARRRAPPRSRESWLLYALALVPIVGALCIGVLPGPRPRALAPTAAPPSVTARATAPSAPPIGTATTLAPNAEWARVVVPTQEMTATTATATKTEPTKRTPRRLK
jgi:hypothetical protein